MNQTIDDKETKGTPPTSETPEPTSAQPVNVFSVIDKGRFGSYQLFVAFLCGLCLILDGFDTQAMGYVAPALIKDWGISKAAMTPAFSAGMFGMMIGSFAFSALADRIGRRPVLIAATLIFSVCMMLTGFANSIWTLAFWRFAAGLGLGCIMPNAMSLAGEYAPQRVRVTLMMMVSCGFTLGGILAGFFSAGLIHLLSWRAVFFIGGALPFFLGLLMLAKLPESLHFLLERARASKQDANVRQQLQRILQESLPADRPIELPQKAPQSSLPFIELFKDGRAVITVLLWVINFANLLEMYFLSNWLPTVISGAGYSTTAAVLAGSALWVGGLVGTVLLGPIIDRLGFTKVLITIFFFGIFSTFLIGNSAVIATTAFLIIAIFVSGFAISGGQPAINALAGTYYPASMRSTGIGWGLGVGRIGSVVGPMIGGGLVYLHWSMQAMFVAAAIPVFVTMLGLIAIHVIRRPQRQAPEMTVLAH